MNGSQASACGEEGSRLVRAATQDTVNRSERAMTDTANHEQLLELADIQGTVLRQRPSPYTGAYFFLRIDDPADGRRMLRRLAPQVATAANWWQPPEKAWLNVALSYSGLRALGNAAGVPGPCSNADVVERLHEGRQLTARSG